MDIVGPELWAIIPSPPSLQLYVIYFLLGNHDAHNFVQALCQFKSGEAQALLPLHLNLNPIESTSQHPHFEAYAYQQLVAYPF